MYLINSWYLWQTLIFFSFVDNTFTYYNFTLSLSVNAIIFIIFYIRFKFICIENYKNKILQYLSLQNKKYYYYTSNSVRVFYINKYKYICLFSTHLTILIIVTFIKFCLLVHIFALHWYLIKAFASIQHIQRLSF